MTSRYTPILRYLKRVWTISPDTKGNLPWLARLILHLTLNGYGDAVFEKAESPFTETSVTREQFLAALYAMTIRGEDHLIRTLLNVAVLGAVLAIFGIMTLLSHLLPPELVLALYLILIGLTFILKNNVIDVVTHWVKRKSYSHVLFRVLYG